MLNPDRLWAAYKTARHDLVSACGPQGHWTGELASSALSTATAVSALAVVERQRSAAGLAEPDESLQELGRRIMHGLHWLAERQNADGGWADTDKSLSNIATTMLVEAAFRMTCVPADHADMLERAANYIRKKRGIAGLKARYAGDQTFAAPILANCALAGTVAWHDVPSLPFELACFPQKWWRRLRLPVVSYALPALVAIGQVKYFHRKPLNPLSRLVRGAALQKSIRVVDEMQPESGGFLEATPLTSFVVMSLASIGLADHAIVRRAVQFLLASARPDGSWPIDSNLASWNTTLAVGALAGAGEDVGELECLDWLLACQHKKDCRYSGAKPGGWAWTDLSGGVPDSDDTSGALLALAEWIKVPLGKPRINERPPGEERLNGHAAVDTAKRAQVCAAASDGANWLLDLQNRDGGWPTFCRGWGKLPFDRSGCDLTAHALRALAAWRGRLGGGPLTALTTERSVDRRIDVAIERGLAFLSARQEAEGSWLPLWFGNQFEPDEGNRVYGTARVIQALRDLNRLDTQAARRGLDFLVARQNADGGWGGPKGSSTVEETALAAEALVTGGRSAAYETAAHKGLKWLVDCVQENRHHESSPIGFYFAKLWYYEKLYPLIFTVAALGRALRRPIEQNDLPSTLPMALQK